MDSRGVGGTIDGIGHWITRRAFLSGDRTAVIDGNRRISYTEFDRRTDQLAWALRELGVRQGDRVAILLFNSAAFLELLFATAKVGAVFVPINFRLAPPEVTYLLSDSGADVFVWSDQLSRLAREALTLVDRKKDMIITGGENVYPIEVEQVLWRHQAVREVAVVGVPHPKWGETPVAVVAVEDGVDLTGDELIAFAPARLAHFKCPTRVEYVSELPRDATGKILKTELRKQFGGEESAVHR